MLQDVDLEKLVGKKCTKAITKGLYIRDIKFVVNFGNGEWIVERKACYWAFTIADSLCGWRFLLCFFFYGS